VKKEHSFTIASRIEEVRSIAVALRVLWERWNICNTLAVDLELAVIEALNNIVRHSYHNDPTRFFSLRVWIEEDNLFLELVDSGHPNENFGHISLEFSVEDMATIPEGGMGSHIMHSIMDEITYSVGEYNTLRMRRSLIS
jgi:anti-sigma regulatory factor (Ser/Thr protein kinase)